MVKPGLADRISFFKAGSLNVLEMSPCLFQVLSSILGSVNTPKLLKVRLIADISILSRLPNACTTAGMMGKHREQKSLQCSITWI